MCRLLGKIADNTTDVVFPFFNADRPFKSFIKEHGHGWGIGWYKNGIPKIFKEGLSEKGSADYYEFNKVKEVKSKIIIAHLRKIKSEYKFNINSQPFRYKNWLFAHNGGINKERVFNILEERCRKLITSGTNLDSYTDSELYFLMIMQELDKRGNILNAIKETINKIKMFGDYTGLNFLLSDGEQLYAFRDASRKHDYYSLFYIKRDVNQINNSEKAVLICSEKLTYKEQWEEIKLGSLIIVEPDLSIHKKTITEMLNV